VQVLYLRTVRPVLLHVAPEGLHTYWGGLKPFMDSILSTAWPKVGWWNCRRRIAAVPRRKSGAGWCPPHINWPGLRPR